MSSRQQRFKNKGAYDAQELRRRREEEGIQLRKQKYEENLNKKRVMHAVETDNVNIDDASMSGLEGRSDQSWHIQLLEKLNSPNISDQLEATQQYRKLLSQEPSPPIEQVVKLGIVPKLIQFLDQDENVSLQFEAAWALTNIASGTTEQTHVVIAAGGIDRFVRLLNSPNLDVKEQSVWGLGNIAGDSPAYRDCVLDTACLPTILEILKDPNSRLSMLRNATWALSNLCRGKEPPPNPAKVNIALPVLTQLMMSDDADIVTDACWGISYLSDGPNERIQYLVDCPGLIATLVQKLAHPQFNVISAALRGVGNIVTGDDNQTQCVIDNSALPLLRALLSNPKDAIKKEACWTISNITAGTKPQIQEVIDADLFRIIIGMIPNVDFKTCKEAAWVITNATTGGSGEQIHHIVEEGAIPALCSILSFADSKIISVALTGLDNILSFGQTKFAASGHPNFYAIKVEECGGLDKIESLQSHENMNIYRKSLSIIEKYFGSEDGGDGLLGTEDMLAAAAENPMLWGGGMGPAGEGSNMGAHGTGTALPSMMNFNAQHEQAYMMPSPFGNTQANIVTSSQPNPPQHHQQQPFHF